MRAAHPGLSSAPALSRRGFLRGLGAGATSILVVGGCGYYAAESGDAYAPWRYPDPVAAPEVQAVHAAVLAASPHNTQPWLFAITPERIDVYADLDRSLGAMDGLHREMYIGLGCALDNLVLTARHLGRRAQVTYLPDPDDPSWAARVELAPAAPEPQPLHGCIARRHTNRGRYLDRAPVPGLAAALSAQIEPDLVDVVRLYVLSEPGDMDRVRAGTIRATEAIIADDQMNQDSHHWYRHSQDELSAHRDGITLDASGADTLTRTVGKMVGRPSAAEAGDYWLEATRGRQTTASAYCVLSTPAWEGRGDQLRCGRVYQRMHLWVVSQGLAVQPLNQMLERRDREQALGLGPAFTDELRALLDGDAGAQMLFRIGVPWDPAKKSPRRPPEWVTL
ncbi:Acg family FMN-binding oxidoreductase [Haliangium sp.]|uniref:Acg family FMN-binding oxidoreductase n=1 Tax=Haliangium sp. TaxID=2663208 RepID=UPI003D11E78E